MDESDATGEQVVLTAQGHENVSATHGSTFEVTSDDYLTPAGDCILAVEADLVPAEFDEAFVQACQRADATITLTLETGDHTETVEASGHPDLTFESERGAVVRTSEYVDERTIAVEADRASADLGRDLIGALAAGESLTLTISVETPGYSDSAPSRPA